MVNYSRYGNRYRPRLRGLSTGARALGAVGALHAAGHNYLFGKPTNRRNITQPRSVAQTKAMVRYGKRTKRGKKRKGKKMGKNYTRSMLRKLIDRRIKRMKITGWSLPQYYMTFDTGTMTSPVNQNALHEFHLLDNVFTQAAIDDTVPSINNATITWKDLSSAASNAKIYWFKTSMKLEICNNYNYGVKLCYWIIKNNDNSAVSPGNHLKLKMDKIYFADTGGPTPVSDTSMEVRQFNESEITPVIRKTRGFHIVKKGTCVISPGQTKNLIMFIPKAILNMNDYNAYASPTYIKGVTYTLLISIRGQVAHETTDSNLVGWSDTKLDYTITRRAGYKIRAADELEHRNYASSLDVVADPNVVTMDIEEKTDVEG